MREVILILKRQGLGVLFVLDFDRLVMSRALVKNDSIILNGIVVNVAGQGHKT